MAILAGGAIAAGVTGHHSVNRRSAVRTRHVHLPAAFTATGRIALQNHHISDVVLNPKTGVLTWKLTAAARLSIRALSHAARLRLPAVALDMLTSRLYAEGYMTRYPDPLQGDPVVFWGYAAARSSRDPRSVGCLMFGGGIPARGSAFQVIKLLGATGAAAGLRLTVRLPARSLASALGPQGARAQVTLRRGSPHRIPGSCKALLLQIPASSAQRKHA